MTIDRRKFIQTTIAGSAVLAIGGFNSVASASSKKNKASGKAKLNISFRKVPLPVPP